jgi:hypothetical protein
LGRLAVSGFVGILNLEGAPGDQRLLEPGDSRGSR